MALSEHNSRIIKRGIIGTAVLAASVSPFLLAANEQSIKGYSNTLFTPTSQKSCESSRNKDYIRQAYTYPFNRVSGKAFVSYDPISPYDEGFVELHYNKKDLTKIPLPPEIELPTSLGFRNGKLEELVITATLLQDQKTTSVIFTLSESTLESSFFIDKFVGTFPTPEVDQVQIVACWANERFTRADVKSGPRLLIPITSLP